MPGQPGRHGSELTYRFLVIFHQLVSLPVTGAAVGLPRLRARRDLPTSTTVPSMHRSTVRVTNQGGARGDDQALHRPHRPHRPCRSVFVDRERGLRWQQLHHMHITLSLLDPPDRPGPLHCWMARMGPRLITCTPVGRAPAQLLTRRSALPRYWLLDRNDGTVGRAVADTSRDMGHLVAGGCCHRGLSE